MTTLRHHDASFSVVRDAKRKFCRQPIFLLLPQIIHYKYKLQVITPRLDHYFLRVFTRTHASQAKRPSTEHRRTRKLLSQEETTFSSKPHTSTAAPNRSKPFQKLCPLLSTWKILWQAVSKLKVRTGACLNNYFLKKPLHQSHEKEASSQRTLSLSQLSLFSQKYHRFLQEVRGSNLKQAHYILGM